MNEITGRLQYEDMGSGEWYLISPALEGRRVRVFPNSDQAVEALAQTSVYNDATVTIETAEAEVGGATGGVEEYVVANRITAHL